MENVVKTKHFHNSYRLQSAGTYHPRALRLRKEVVGSVQNNWKPMENYRICASLRSDSASARRPNSYRPHNPIVN